MTDLARKRVRESLPVRREAYWQRLAAGAYLGFRRGPDTWQARFRGRDGKQTWQALGEALEYDEAKRRAEDWLSQLSRGAVRSVKRDTVRAALEAYLADLRRHGRPDAATNALRRFKKLVWNDPIANIALESATRDDFEEFRDRQLDKTRKPRTLNRHFRSIAAGLNKSLELGHVGNPRAWTLAALADDIEDSGETAVYLTAEQRRAIIAAATPWAAAYLRGLELTGARPLELASAVVADFNGETLRLSHRKGKPPKLRVRHVVLSAEGVAFFERQTTGKLPKAPLFTENGELAWRTHMWARRIREAIAAHNEKAKAADRPMISLDASAYSFRHARISELLQVHAIDPLTVAAQTETSLVMIEKSYLKFIPSAMRAKLAAVKETAGY